MPAVTVYAYEVYMPEQDGFVPANVFATLEAINESKLLRPIMSISHEVDVAELNERGRYHPPKTAPDV